MQLKDVTPIIKAILEERDKIPRIIDQERYIPNPQPYHDGDCMRGGIRKALRIIEQAPVVAAMPRWISVEESLPEDDDVLTRRATGMSIESHCGFGWAYDEYNGKWRVTHWMPLPEPPGVEV